MCSGRVDLGHVFRAFSQGADGVFIGACHLGECNYITHGNYHALTMTHLAKKILSALGLSPDRVRIQFMSGAEANVYVEAVNEFVRQVRELGPLGRGEGLEAADLAFKLDAAAGLIPYIRLVERERLRLPALSEADVERFFAGDELRRIFAETIAEKLALSQIVSLLRKGPLSTAEIARGVGLTPSQVAKHLSTSSRHRLVRYDESAKRYALV